MLPQGGTPGYTYSWIPGAITTQSASGLAAGTYTVYVNDANGCFASASTTVGSTGGAPATPGPINGPIGVCRNQSGVVFSTTPIAGATSYTWTLPSGVTGSSNSNSITLAFSSTYNTGTISVKANNACGSSSAVSRVATKLIAAPSKPGIIVGSKNICTSTQTEFSIASVANAESYLWTVSGTGITLVNGQGTTTVKVLTSSSFVSGTISVVASNCYGNSGTRTMKVYAPLTTAPVFATNSGSDNPTNGVCGGSSYDFEIIENDAALSYTWTAPVGCIIDDRMGHTGNPLTVVGRDPYGEYEVVITFPSGFISGAVTVFANNTCSTSPVASLAVRSKPPVPGIISGPTTNLCGKTGVVYSIAAVNGATSYSWTVPSGVSIVSNTGTSIKVNFGNSFTGTGSLKVAAKNGCGTSETSKLALNAAPETPGTINGASTVCKSSTSVIYTIGAVSGATSYYWTVSNGATIVGTNTGLSVKVKFTGTTASTVVLKVKSKNTCGNSLNSELLIAVNAACRTTETAEEPTVVNGLMNITTYPNPTSDKLMVHFESTENQQYSIKLIDLLGKVHYAINNTSQEGINQLSIDVSSYPKGIYFLFIEEKATEVVRIVIE